MLKFKGKFWEINGYFEYLKFKFGGKTTIKEICERIGAN
jgi:hypothetical protein